MNTSLRNPSVPIRINVNGGTLPDKFLCESCEHACVMRGGSIKQVQIRCSAFDGPSFIVPFRVVQCRRYSETDSTDLRRMKNEAYYVHKTAHGGCHMVTRAQYDDYDYMQKLEERDARKVLRTRTVKNPRRKQ